MKNSRRDCLETLVELTPKMLEVLTKPSIVACNDLKEISLAEFNARFMRKEIGCFDKDLPVALRKALR